MRTMQRIGLEDLPEEVIECTVELLDFDSITALRLTSRNLRDRCSNGHFKRLYSRKTVDISNSHQLAQLLEQTEPDRLGRTVKHLTICADVTKVDSLPCQEDLVSALARGLSNVSTLQTLVLEVSQTDESGHTVTHERDAFVEWRATWCLASILTKLVIAAVRESKVNITKLALFNRERCSLACDEIHWLTELAPAFFDQLDSLTLSISHRIASKRDLGSREPSSNSRSDIVNIARPLENVLVSCHQLSSLSIHWFNLNGYMPDDDEFNDACFFNFFEQTPSFNNLTACTLRGLRCDGEALLRLLKSAPLQEVTLQSIHLTHGKFQPLFDHLISKCPLEAINLDLLVEGRQSICFAGPGKPRVPRRKNNGPEYLHRLGDEAKQPIRYKFIQGGRALGSWATLAAHAQSVLKYGPPDARVGPFLVESIRQTYDQNIIDAHATSRIDTV